MKSLLIIDDHEVVRMGVRQSLEKNDFQVVDESSSIANLSDLIRKSNAEMAIVDVIVGKTNAFSELEKLHKTAPDFPVLVYTGYDNPTYVRRAIELDLYGYLLKSEKLSCLVSAVKKMSVGEKNWTVGEMRRVTGAMATPRTDFDTEVPLTRRESEVLVQVVRGLTNKEIATELKISYETVKEHVQHILRKIGVSDRTQAAVWAVRKGIA